MQRAKYLCSAPSLSTCPLGTFYLQFESYVSLLYCIILIIIGCSWVIYVDSEPWFATIKVEQFNKAFKYVLLKYFNTFRNGQVFKLVFKYVTYMRQYISSLVICLILCVKFDKRGKYNAFVTKFNEHKTAKNFTISLFFIM